MTRPHFTAMYGANTEPIGGNRYSYFGNLFSNVYDH